MNNFLADGGDSFPGFKAGKPAASTHQASMSMP